MSTNEAHIAALEQQVKTLEARVSNLQAAILEYEKNQAALKLELRSLTEQVEELEEERTNLYFPPAPGGQ